MGLAGVAINGTIVILSSILANQKARLGAEEILAEIYGWLASRCYHVDHNRPFYPITTFFWWEFLAPLSVVIVGGIGLTLIFLAFVFMPLAYKIYADFIYRDYKKL